jgi:phage terminase small subunit
MAKTHGAKGGGGRPSELSQLAIKGGDHPPEKPIDMKGEFANELWDIALETLPHVLRKVDGPVLRLACESYQQAMLCFQVLASEPLDVSANKMAMAAITKFETLAKSLGLNPHSRRVIKPANSETQASKEDDPMQEWLRRGGLN